MKKTLVRVFTLVLATLMIFALVSCDKSKSVQKAFEKEGYDVTSVKASDSAIGTIIGSTLTSEQREHLDEYELMLCKKGLLDSALVIKFSSEKELKEFFAVEKDGKKDYSAYDKAEKDGLVNGNCYIITISGNAKDVFKGA